jgi:uncharacterized damage-inducible protein DinB
MKVSDFIVKSLTESQEYVADAIKGLSQDELTWRPEPHSNNIAFLLWHLARVEDLWISRILLAGKELYETGGWYKKFGTPAQDSGFGYDVAKISSWSVPPLKLLTEYARAVREKTLAYLNSLTAAKLDEARDFGWSKGTIGSALSHLINEVAEHSGQIGYLRGIMRGIEPPPPPPKNLT